jgi:hypothetical protein
MCIPTQLPSSHSPVLDGGSIELLVGIPVGTIPVGISTTVHSPLIQARSPSQSSCAAQESPSGTIEG